MAGLATQYQQFIHQSRYARWNESTGRRETWDETVSRYCGFFRDRFGDRFPYDRVYSAILNLEVMPSMRCLMTAGAALDRDEIAGFNCSYLPIDHPRAFDEVMYLLMCGTGVGFSVEQHEIKQLPEIAEEFHETSSILVVPDSKLGWASSFRELISFLYSGRLAAWDLSRLRPAGAPLKTFGGRSSGPEPLRALFTFTTNLFKKAAGRRLTALECHDLICKIADIVVVGGVRRSALISLSDLGDDGLRSAKTGSWWISNVQRSLANNSAVYLSKPSVDVFLKEWTSLYESKSGERGIFNRGSATRKAEESTRRETEGIEFGTNPCGEIILRPNGLCNLSEVVVRVGDSFEDIRRKVEIAAIIGTFQSTLTNFRYVRPIWRRNAEEERLLGVSLTGIMDHEALSGQSQPDFLPQMLRNLKNEAIKTNAEWAKIIGISASVAITTVKPSGTVSQLVDSSSGIHPRQFPYYLRTVRNDKKDPLSTFLQDSGVYSEDDVTNISNSIFYFPQKAPVGSVTTDELSAIAQLDHYLIFRDFYCEHNPSITVYVRENEWISVGAWVYEHFDDVGGVSFLPLDDHVYQQAPYQKITEEEFKEWTAKTPTLDWERLRDYETENTTTITHDLACSAGFCEL